MLADILSRIWEAVSQAPPWVVVPPDEAGVIVRLGRVRRVVTGGCFWKIPFVERVRTICIAEDSSDLPNQTIESADGRRVSVSGYIRYHVVDARKAILAVRDYDTLLPRQAMKEIAGAISGCKTLRLAEIESAVEDTLEEHAARWGLSIDEFGLTDLSSSLVVRIIQ